MQHTIRGTVISGEGIPVKGVEAALFLVNASGEKPAGTCKVSKEGNFQFDLQSPATETNFDLIVRIKDASGLELANSGVRYDMKNGDSILVEIRDKMAPGLTEYERIIQDITPHIPAGVSIKDLKESGGKGQVSYASNKSKWDARLVAMVVESLKVSSDLDISGEHVYALFRSRVITDPKEILGLNPSELTELIQAAVGEKIIPGKNPIANSIKVLQKKGVPFLLSEKNETTYSNLEEMLSLRLNAEQKKKFTEVFQQYGEEPTIFWEELSKKGFDEKTIRQLRLDGKVGFLTGQNAPLIKKLYAKYEIGQDLDLVRNGLYDPLQWEPLIGENLPPGTTVQSYAEKMATSVKLGYPTATLGQMIGNAEIVIGATVPRDELREFFIRNDGKYKIGVDPVKTWDGFGQLSEEARTGAKRTERLYQLTPSDDAMASLAAMGVDSAYQLTTVKKEDFLRLHADKFRVMGEAEKVYDRANDIYSASLNIASSYITTKTLPNIYGITGKTEKAVSTDADYPVLEELFNNLEYCSCDHCKSVLSPAAYMVDLLKLIGPQSAEGVPPVTALDHLFSRRPDLQHIQLSCENTNTALPYVDIVNEILEHYIIHGNLHALSGHDHTEFTDPGALLAEPEYVEEAAYTALQQKVYPYNLPFHFPLESVRLLYQLWGIQFRDALRVFRGGEIPVNEVLELSPEEFRTLTELGYKELPEYFGAAPGTTIGQLNLIIANAKVFTKRMDITYDELIGLLRCRFINPGVELVPAFRSLQMDLVFLQKFYEGTVTETELDSKVPAGIDLSVYGGDVKSWLRTNRSLIMGLITLTDTSLQPVECSGAALELRYALPVSPDNQLTELAYYKLHRFIRLSKKTGWPIAEIDSLFVTLLKVSPQQLDLSSLDEHFTSLLKAIAHFKCITELLGIAENEFEKVLQLFDASLEESVRRNRCSEFLKLQAGELDKLCILCGSNPFINDLESNEPAFLRLVRVQQQLKTSSLKINDLYYIVTHKEESGHLQASEERVLQHIQSLREGLLLAEQETHVDEHTADMTIARNKFNLVFDQGLTEEFFALLQGSVVFHGILNIPAGLPEKLQDMYPKLSYDPFRGKLGYPLLLSNDEKDEMIRAVNSLTTEEIVAAGIPEPERFKEHFKNAVEDIHQAGNSYLSSLRGKSGLLASLYEEAILVKPLSAQVQVILKKILPDLKIKLRSASLSTRLSSLLKIEENLVRTILSDPKVIHADLDPAQDLLSDFLHLEDDPEFKNGETNFYLAAPATDEFMIYIEAPEGTAVSLWISGKLLLDGVRTPETNEIRIGIPEKLNSGKLIVAKLVLAGLSLGERVSLSWQTQGSARSAVTGSAIYNYDRVRKAMRSMIRVQKSLQLQKMLKLTPEELVYFAGENPSSKNFLNEFSIGDPISSPGIQALFNKLVMLSSFGDLKQENEPAENAWIGVLRQPTIEGLSGITRWQKIELEAVLNHFSISISEISNLATLFRVVETMTMIGKTGCPPEQLIRWTINNPGFEVPREIRAQIRSASLRESWIDSLSGATDPLRNRSRDALVAYVLQYKRPLAEIDTPDKLYEYFLVDVQTDASMKTSRIRLALSSIQLFIQRCLMNLERNCNLSISQALEWQWMKRYRVWEANRKIFLYPENWLEPELRDNKSFLFRELEGELLQREINEDSAEEAFLNYLRKLDDLGRLEIAGMFVEEDKNNRPEKDIVHLIGCSNGNSRQHYYRRHEKGCWTSWEKVNLPVDGEHIYPIIWNKRLYLFWLNITEKTEEPAMAKKPKELADENLEGQLKNNIEIQLCWGEYYKGKWSSPKSTELDKPMFLKDVRMFNKKYLRMYGRTYQEGVKHNLLLYLSYTADNAPGRPSRVATFTFSSKSIPPLIQVDFDRFLHNDVGVFNTLVYSKGYSTEPISFRPNHVVIHSSELLVNISQPGDSTKRSKRVISKIEENVWVINQFRLRHPVRNQWEAPFTYSDEHANFIIKPEEEILPFTRFEGYYERSFRLELPTTFKFPKVIERPRFPIPPKPGVKKEIFEPDPDIIFKNSNYDMALGNEDIFKFEGQEFGAEGWRGK